MSTAENHHFDDRELFATVILAAIGAAVSFVVTLLLQRWQRRRAKP